MSIELKGRAFEISENADHLTFEKQKEMSHSISGTKSRDCQRFGTSRTQLFTRLSVTRALVPKLSQVLFSGKGNALVLD